MENFLLLLGIGAFVIFIILRFDKSQKKRVGNVLGNTGKVEPLFMKQAAEQKMFTLRKAMSDFEKTLTATHISPSGEESYQKIEAKLKEIVSNYSVGTLPLNVYCSKLDSLITTVERLKKDLVSSAA